MEQSSLERTVHRIPASRSNVGGNKTRLHGRQRVAAYCRVSTDSEEQINSYTAQKAYYTQKIEESPDWELAGIFADEGITGTSMKKRKEFNRMITACKRGGIDLILTKSLSRILQGASARYACCDDGVDAAKSQAQPNQIDWDHFERTVSHIIIGTDNVITVHF